MLLSILLGGMAHGAELASGAIPLVAYTASDSTPEPRVESDPDGDLYTLAPLVQDEEFAHFMDDDRRAKTLRFNEDWKEIGFNRFSSNGGRLWAIETIQDLGNDRLRIAVQVSALDSNNDPEPWVDGDFEDSGFLVWRLDIGANLGGDNRIEPDQPFTVLDSGVVLFDSDGDVIGNFSLGEDASDASGLAGTALINLSNDANIAGFDLSSMVIFWEIQLEPGNSGFQVSSGQSGAWYDLTHNGEGYVLQVLSDNTAVVYWFTYDADGNQVWMLGLGEVRGSRIVFDEILITRGGKFGPDFDPDDVELSVWGSLEFRFSDCTTAVVTYDGPSGFGSGTLNVTKLSTIWGFSCAGDEQPLNVKGVGHLAPGFTGSWFDPRHDGEGFTLEIINETTALIFWFTYDTEGNQAWMMMIAEIQGASIFANEVWITSGGRFGPNFDPDDVRLEQWGSAVFSFGTCTTSGHGGSMRYLPPEDFGPEATQLLVRLTFIENLGCRFLADTQGISSHVTVGENIFVDGDTNDPNVAEVPNDLDDGLPEQQLVAPARVAGFVTATSTGEAGDRFENAIDPDDAYLLTLREGEGVILTVADWDPQDATAVDLDLFLAAADDPETIVDSSLSTNERESVVAPEDGDYIVVVQAFAGTSNYLLQSGQSGITAAGEQIDITAPFVSGQIMAAIRDEATLTSVSARQAYMSRVKAAESKLGLHRIKQSPAGEVLYAINQGGAGSLPPHPLTATGLGSITPEQWQVVRAAKQLAADPDFRWAGPNYLYNTYAVPNDPGYEAQWHYDLIRLPEAWDVTRGDDVIVAVIDSGVWDHPDLASNVDYGLGYDFVSGSIGTDDGDGIDPDARDPGDLNPELRDYVSHGTHVAGTIGARTNNNAGVAGVNWDVTIMPVRAMRTNGSGSCYDISQALRWAGRLANDSGTRPGQAAAVINMSLGGRSPCSGMQDIIDQLNDRGIIVIAAAGNDGSSTPIYPASLEHVFSVSATTLADDLAPYSSFGSNVDFAAPGGDLTEDLDNDDFADGVLSPTLHIEQGSSAMNAAFFFLQGTSMAAPHAAGVAALMKSVFPGLDQEQLHTALATGQITVDLAENGPTNRDSKFGYGRIDALEAVQWAVKAEQGQESAAFIAGSLSAFDFQSELELVELTIEKAGSGDLAIAATGVTEPWIGLSVVDVDAGGFGRYAITIERGDLPEGQYSGWAWFDADNGFRYWVSVLMRVGDSVPGQAGYLYSILLDQWTLQNVKSWQGPQEDAGFDVAHEDLPPGTYFFIVSTDLDRDFTICDPGELCEFYPSNSTISPIVVEDSDIGLGTFRISFPAPDLDTQASPGAAPADGAPGSRLRRMIGAEGIRYRALD